MSLFTNFFGLLRGETSMLSVLQDAGKLGIIETRFVCVYVLEGEICCETMDMVMKKEQFFTGKNCQNITVFSATEFLIYLNVVFI